MAHEHLADFLSELEAAGEVCRVPALVEDDELTAAAHLEAIRSDQPACLLFERRPHGRLPVVVHLLATPSRVLRALHCESPDALLQRIAAALPPPPATDWRALWHWVPLLCSTVRRAPTRADSAVVQQVVRLGRDVNLSDFGFPRLWPDDVLPVISGGIVLVGAPAARHTSDSVTNVPATPQPTAPRSDAAPPAASRSEVAPLVMWSVCPILEPDVVAIPISDDEPLAGLMARARTEQQPLPVAITLGGDPGLFVVAAVAAAFGTDPWELAGLIRNDSLPVTGCRTVPLTVPANAEIVLEGFLDPQRPVETIGPLTDLDGLTADCRHYVRVRLTAVSHRSNPVLPVCLGRRAPNERTCVLGAAERLWLPLIRRQLPDVADWHFPPDSGGRHVIVALRRFSAAQVRRVCHALWGFGPAHTCRMIVLVDADADIRNPRDVWGRVATLVDWREDVLVTAGPADDAGGPPQPKGEQTAASYAATERLSGRIAIDATRKPQRGVRFAKRPPELLQQAAALFSALSSGSQQAEQLR